MAWISDPQAWVAFLTLTVLEIVLGIDNIIFISILAGKLPKEKQKLARQLGLFLAMFTRIILLFSLSLLMRLTEPLFEIFNREISGKDLILIGGGLFLLGKATLEIHEKMEGPGKEAHKKSAAGTFGSILIQIIILDIVFSLDSVITAVGMVEHLSIMVAAVVVAVIFMLIFVNPVSSFVDKHPTVKILALSFLLMVGLALMGEGLHFHIPKGYIYFAMAFSVFVEMVNLRIKKVSTPSESS